MGKQDLSWTAKIGGVDNFDITIAGVDECLFNLTFNQKGGDVLDLSALRQHYDVTWTFDHSSAIDSSDINGGTLQVKRKEDDNSDVSVVLRLKSRSDGNRRSQRTRSDPEMRKVRPRRQRQPRSCADANELTSTFSRR